MSSESESSELRLGWVEALPKPLRFAIRGAMFVVGYAIFKALIAGVALLLFMPVFGRPWSADQTRGVGVLLALAIGGGAVAGAMYGVLGRALLRYGRVGQHLTGTLISFPYFFALGFALRALKYGEALLRWPDGRDFVLAGGIAILAGGLIGRDFSPLEERADGPRGPT